MTALVFPSSPTSGQQYTAAGRTWEWDGLTWFGVVAATSNIYFNGPFTPPVSTDFTWINQETTSVLDKSDRMQVTIPDTGSTDNYRLLTKVLPFGTPYTITYLASCSPFPNIAYSGMGVGMALANDAGNLRFITMHGSSATAYYQNSIPYIVGATSYSTGLTVVNGTSSMQWNPGFFGLRITDNGTTRKYWISSNGKSWTLRYSEATNTGITPTKYGMTFYHSNASSSHGWSPVLDILHLSVVNSILSDES